MKEPTQLDADWLNSETARLSHTLADKVMANPSLLNDTLAELYTSEEARTKLRLQLTALMGLATQAAFDPLNTKTSNLFLHSVEGCKLAIHWSINAQLAYEWQEKHRETSHSE